TGLERQLIGVKIPAADGVSMHGALLMALLPDRTSPADGFAVQDAKAPLTMSGTICFAADPLTGEILYASDAGMIGRTLAEYDLPEESLQDGYMDFTSIAGSDYLVISSRENERVYYYAAQSNAMFGRIIRVGAFAALLFAAALAILLLFLLGGYTEKRCEDWEQARKKESAGTDSPRSGGSVEEKTEGSGKKADLLDRILGFLHWDQKRSGEKTSITLHIGLIILILCALDALHAKQLPNDSYNTMLGFLMHGGWMRGLNLFSLCSILMVVAVAYLINLISSLLLRMSRGVISENGDTVCLLLYSCIKYVTVFGVVYFSLGYLGFSTTTVLASLGIVSLALSLGAQDLIKDILAGLALVFDGCFRVGDVVEIGGTRGTVEEIGVRSTKLRDFDNNTLILNNHEITGILNLSKALTELSLELKIPANLSLLEVEDLLNRELPKIGAKSDKIIEGPYLLGVTDMGGTNIPLGVQIVTLTVTAMFNAKDSLAVKVFLNREICLLFEREGIPLL
ncbi:MAG: mechanosensitive ion channel, partial [Oscillospiraceae bacterium]|nr:mechanosensitive ion channel [Oscillospiraceae bacterium]